MTQQIFVLGMNAKLYQGESGAALADMVEMSNVQEVTLTLDAGEANVSTRGNGGWEATAATLRKCAVEFQMLWKPGDACFNAIKTAYLTAGQVALAALTGAKDAVNSEGVLADFSITKFERKEPLEEGITVSVTAKLAQFRQWVQVTQQGG